VIAQATNAVFVMHIARERFCRVCWTILRAYHTWRVPSASIDVAWWLFDWLEVRWVNCDRTACLGSGIDYSHIELDGVGVYPKLGFLQPFRLLLTWEEPELLNILKQYWPCASTTFTYEIALTFTKLERSDVVWTFVFCWILWWIVQKQLSRLSGFLELWQKSKMASCVWNFTRDTFLRIFPYFWWVWQKTRGSNNTGAGDCVCSVYVCVYLHVCCMCGFVIRNACYKCSDAWLCICVWSRNTCYTMQCQSSHSSAVTLPSMMTPTVSSWSLEL